MRILILTQVLDKNNSILGFFHQWVEEFAKNAEQVTVICLFRGEHTLPKNVRVLSLGKEDSVTRLEYIRRFYMYCWKERFSYDTVFTHMNQEYVLLGAWLWRLLGKRVTMWRNHYAGSVVTNLAVLLCHKVFCTSKYSYTAKFKRTILMPVGVPEDLFRPMPSVARIPNSILSFGRIAPSKKIEQLITALNELHVQGIDATLTICGDTSAENKWYRNLLKQQVATGGIENRVIFKEGIPYSEAPALYAAHTLCVNQSPSGMFDKTIFEAMMCGTLVLSCNENLRGEVDDVFIFTEDDIGEIVRKLGALLKLSLDEQRERALSLQKYAAQHHGLKHLACRLQHELTHA